LGVRNRCGPAVFEIWESEADLAAFGQLLGPIITEMGLGSGQPVVVPLHRLVQEARSGLSRRVSA